PDRFDIVLAVRTAFQHARQRRDAVRVGAAGELRGDVVLDAVVREDRLRGANALGEGFLRQLARRFGAGALRLLIGRELLPAVRVLGREALARQPHAVLDVTVLDGGRAAPERIRNAVDAFGFHAASLPNER